VHIHRSADPQGGASRKRITDFQVHAVERDEVVRLHDQDRELRLRVRVRGVGGTTGSRQQEMHTTDVLRADASQIGSAMFGLS